MPNMADVFLRDRLNRSRRIDHIDSIELDSYDIEDLFVILQTFSRFKTLPHFHHIFNEVFM